MSPVKSIAGQRFGRLTALSISGKVGRVFLWLCRCDCGKDHIVRRNNLTSGEVLSCGCLSDERRRETMRQNKAAFTGSQKTHGKYGTPTHRTWIAMLRRCTNPNSDNYAYYGGRGIKVCERWRKFENFLTDMGEKPSGTTIERNDNDGNYEPDNCRWATMKEQSNNRRPRGQGAVAI